jgi:predicted Zn-dependent peptidase
LPASFVHQQSKLLNASTKKEMDDLIRKWLRLDGMNIVLAGDLEKMRAG